MRKKQLGLTTAMAATLTALGACSTATDDDWDSGPIAQSDTRVCVNQNGERIDEDSCEGGRHYIRGSGVGWYYMGRGSRLPYLGDSVRNSRYGFVGSSMPMPGVNYASAPSSANMTRSSARARGGFGSSGRGFGGGRS
jgi:hypothetical protein